MTRRLFLVLACIIFAGAHASAQSRTTLVILVRHAEKAAEPAADPSLTPAGTVRARALAAALANVRVEAVITTELVRTGETALPVAEARGLTFEIVHTGARDAHANAVADAVRAHAGQAVLVVGHSNTIPAIIAALGGPKLPDICDTQYSTLFVLVVGEGRADLVVSSYGAPSPDPTTTCPSSQR
jgi:broad specificity phosphatase PhoE